MQTPNIRTTILFRPAVFKRLKLLSQEENKPVSEIVNLAVQDVLETGDKPRLKRMYEGLFALAGKGKQGVTDASVTVDQLLYGESGVWKGDHE